MGAIYRVRQFAQAAATRVRPAAVDEDLLRQILPPRAVALFLAMPGYDRQHAMAVFRALRAAGHDESDLLAAALLHDVGKSGSGLARIRIWHRVATVLLQALWPGALERIGRDVPGSWRRPFFVQQNHASLGAELAREACCSPGAVALIRRHEEIYHVGDDALLAALQAADSLH
ncbi:MAG: HD domain-containing protein [Anaerolineaceae bacterium]|nr:HD domain-containing protein [Anaerolineaceae bacterium]